MYCHLLQNIHHFYLECDICSFVTFSLMLLNSFNVDILLHLLLLPGLWHYVCFAFIYQDFIRTVTFFLVVTYVFELKFCLIYVWMVFCDELWIVLANFCGISSFCYTSLVNNRFDVTLQWSAHGTLIHGLVDSCSVWPATSRVTLV
jgi:hypothetical protein